MMKKLKYSSPKIEEIKLVKKLVCATIGSS